MLYVQLEKQPRNNSLLSSPTKVQGELHSAHEQILTENVQLCGPVFYYLFTGCFICFHPVITKYGQEITALFLRAHLCGLGYPRQPFPRVTLAELNLLLFLWKLHLTVYMRIANLSRGPDISGGRVVSLRQVG